MKVQHPQGLFCSEFGESVLIAGHMKQGDLGQTLQERGTGTSSIGRVKGRANGLAGSKFGQAEVGETTVKSLH